MPWYKRTDPILPGTAAAVLVLLVILTLLKCARGKRIPGPTRWPIIGNTFGVPEPFRWTWYLTLRRTYGPIFKLHVLRDTVVVVSDPEIAEEMLGRRAKKYSSRKYLPFAGKYRSTNRRMLLMPYGPEFHKQRAAMQLLFRPEGIAANRERQKRQATKLILDLLDSPRDVDRHLKGYSSGVALGVGFGMSIPLARERMPEMLNITRTLGQDLAPGKWMVEMFPILDRLPDILSPWRAKARAAHEKEAKLFSTWAEEVKHPPPGEWQARSLVQQLLEVRERFRFDDKTIAYVGGSIGEAGTNTTQCTLACLLYACASYPDVFKRAQEEIDHIVGNQIPGFSDYSSLPFLFAFVKEILRWVPVTPLALPHLVTESDMYNGLYIPAGSLVVTSLWNMHRDPTLFSNPDLFNPERFYCANDDGKLPADASILDGIYTFGFGRRICPGRRLAVDSVWLVAAYILWAFDIAFDSTVTQTDNEAQDDPSAFLKWRDGVNIEPCKLPMHITVRSPEREAKFRDAWAAITAEGC